MGCRGPTVPLIFAGCIHALFAFFGGFYIPWDQTPVYWRWMLTLSPRFYSSSSLMRMSLQGFSTKTCPGAGITPAQLLEPLDVSGYCNTTTLQMLRDSQECIASSNGDVVLRRFGYQDTPVGLFMLVLLGYTLLYTGLALLFLELDSRAISPTEKVARLLGRMSAAYKAKLAEMALSEETKRADEHSGIVSSFGRVLGVGQTATESTGAAISSAGPSPARGGELVVLEVGGDAATATASMLEGADAEAAEAFAKEEQSRLEFRALFMASDEGKRVVKQASNFLNPADVKCWRPGEEARKKAKEGWANLRQRAHIVRRFGGALDLGPSEREITSRMKQLQRDTEAFADSVRERVSGRPSGASRGGAPSGWMGAVEKVHAPPTPSLPLAEAPTPLA